MCASNQRLDLRRFMIRISVCGGVVGYHRLEDKVNVYSIFECIIFNSLLLSKF